MADNATNKSRVDDAHDARAIAGVLVKRGIEAHDALTPLQVVKLTYLCHGWMLGLYEARLSAQPVEAWQYGPVIPDVYHLVKSHRRNPIRQPLDFPDASLDERQADLVDQVYVAYQDFSGIALSHITHEPGTPWDEIWSKFGRNTIIPDSLIMAHFKELAGNG